jgi:hypothetical protein
MIEDLVLHTTELPLLWFLSNNDNVREALWDDTDYLLAEHYRYRMQQGDVFPPIKVFSRNRTI